MLRPTQHGLERGSIKAPDFEIPQEQIEIDGVYAYLYLNISISVESS